MKKRYLPSLNTEDGFALIIAMMMLVILTLIGMAATNTTILELKISGNERSIAQNFDAADSGWQQAVPYLDRKASPPDFINLSIGTGADQIVRNFGSGADGTVNSLFPAGTQDGVFPNMANLQYWYKVTYDSDSAATGFGPNYRDFRYEVECRTNENAQVETMLSKVYKVGY